MSCGDLGSGLGHTMEFLGFPRLLCSNNQAPMAAVGGQSPSCFE